jgi:hypothetical protein
MLIAELPQGRMITGGSPISDLADSTSPNLALLVL